MPLKKYKNIRFSAEKTEIVNHINRIVPEYDKLGYSLTLRQVFYQFVARDLFPESWADSETGSTNNEKSYKKLGDIISDGR